MITRLILSNEYNTTRHTGKPGPKTLGPWDPQVGPSSETLKWDPQYFLKKVHFMMAQVNIA